MASSTYVTATGLSALASGPVVIDEFRLGDGVGYVPNGSTSGLQGTVVLTGSPSAPEVVSAQTYLYRIILPSNTAMAFGEIALYMAGGALFSLTAFPTLQTKTADPSDLDGVGGYVDVFVQTTGEAFVSLQGAKTAPFFNNISELPSTFQSDINLAVVPDPSVPGGNSSMIAYRRNALWSFDKYDQAGNAASVVTGNFNSFVISGTRETTPDTLVQFITGPLIGITRKVFSSLQSGGQTTIDLDAPVTIAAAAGMQVAFFEPRAASTGGPGASIDLGDLTLAVTDAIGTRPVNVANNSILGRLDGSVDVELSRSEYVATANGTGYSTGNILVRSNWQTAAGSVLTFWFNQSTNTRLDTPPLLGQLTLRTSDSTVNVDTETPLIATSYTVVTAGTGYGINDVVALSRRVDGSGVTTDYWLNVTTAQPITPAPTLANLKPINALKALVTSRVAQDVGVAASTSTQILAASSVRCRRFIIKHPIDATAPLYLKLGTGAGAGAADCDIGPLYPGDQYWSDTDEWGGVVHAFSTSAVTVNVATLS